MGTIDYSGGAAAGSRDYTGENVECKLNPIHPTSCEYDCSSPYVACLVNPKTNLYANS
jgi:hypothetical protein